jgi:membrane associated rhomboid family serine protease
MAQYRFVWPPVTKTVIGIGIVAFLGWFVPTIVEPVKQFAADHLWLTAPNVANDFEVWTLATYAVFHLDFISAFFSALAIWLFGTELQREWGNVKFALVQLAAVVVGGLFAFGVVWLLDMPGPVLGYHAAVIALLTAFCRRYWEQELSLIIVQLKGKHMLAIFLGLNVVLAGVSGAYYAIALDVAGFVVGFFAGRGPGFTLRELRTRFNRWRARRHLKVVRKTPDGEWVN